MKERDLGRDRHGVAVLRSPWDQLQKKTAHAAEQERPDVAARRLAWLSSERRVGRYFCPRPRRQQER